MRAYREQLGHLIVAIGRQTAAMEQHTEAIERLIRAISAQQKPGLGEPDGTRYTSKPDNPDIVDERTMAGILNISNRTLGKYRRQGRFPNCWIRNAGRISWRIVETQETWDRGIA